MRYQRFALPSIWPAATPRWVRAKQIEKGFYADADRIPAEIISEYVARISASATLFDVVREIESASTSLALPPYDELSVEAKSLLGVFLDFNKIPREKIATAWQGQQTTKQASSTSVTDAGPLFDAGATGDTNAPGAKNE